MQALPSFVPASNLAENVRVAFDLEAKTISIPMNSVGDIQSIPGSLFAKLQASFYKDPVDEVFKTLRVE